MKIMKMKTEIIILSMIAIILITNAFIINQIHLSTIILESTKSNSIVFMGITVYTTDILFDLGLTIIFIIDFTSAGFIIFIIYSLKKANRKKRISQKRKMIKKYLKRKKI